MTTADIDQSQNNIKVIRDQILAVRIAELLTIAKGAKK